MFSEGDVQYWVEKLDDESCAPAHNSDAVSSTATPIEISNRNSAGTDLSLSMDLTIKDLDSFYIGVVGNTGVEITIPVNWEFPYGRPFSYGHTWDYENWCDGVIRKAE